MSPLSLISVYEFLAYVIPGGIFIVFAYWLLILFDFDFTSSKFIIPLMSEWFKPLVFVSLSIIFGHLLQGECNKMEKHIIEGKSILPLKLHNLEIDIPLILLEFVFGNKWGGWPSNYLLEGMPGKYYPKSDLGSEYIKNWIDKAKKYCNLSNNISLSRLFSQAYNLIDTKELSKSAKIYHNYYLFYRSISFCGLFPLILGIIIILGLLINYLTNLIGINPVLYWFPPDNPIIFAISLIIIGYYIARSSAERWRRFGERWAVEIIKTFYNVIDNDGKLKN